MLKHGILGLLNYGAMTGYEIKDIFRDSLNYFWTAQTSQVYRELQTMEKKGWVSSERIPQAGRPDKNLFSITEEGRAELRSWLLSTDSGVDNRSDVCMNTFFRGELPREENIKYFERLISESEAFLADTEKPGRSMELYKGAVADEEAALYWRMTLSYGIMFRQMLIDWAKKCIAEIKEEQK